MLSGGGFPRVSGDPSSAAVALDGFGRGRPESKHLVFSLWRRGTVKRGEMCCKRHLHQAVFQSFVEKGIFDCEKRFFASIFGQGSPRRSSSFYWESQERYSRLRTRLTAH